MLLIACFGFQRESSEFEVESDPQWRMLDKQTCCEDVMTDDDDWLTTDADGVITVVVMT